MTKAEKTKQFIIHNTATIFNRKGYSGTSLTDLISATGLTKGSIYGNFENKDEVALAAFDYNVSLLFDGLKAAIAGKTSAIDRLLAMAQFYDSGFRKLASIGGCPILNTAVEADDTHILLREKAVRTIRSWKKMIESIVNQGIQRKEIRAGVNATDFATEFIALIEGGIMLFKVTANAAMFQSCVNRIIKIIKTELKA
jgi:TetR/AcrR family transcriptional repressor of nem operon